MGLLMALIAVSHRVLDHSGFVRRCVPPCLRMSGVLTHLDRDIFIRVPNPDSELHA